MSHPVSSNRNDSPKGEPKAMIPQNFLEPAVRVFGDEDKARRWFDSEVGGLGHRQPIELIKEPWGRMIVKALLAAMEQGGVA